MKIAITIILLFFFFCCRIAQPECLPADVSCNQLLAHLFYSFHNNSNPIQPMLATGANHTCYLNAQGRLRCWGNGSNGRLGYNSAANIGDGVGITIREAGFIDLPQPVRQISAGDAHTCAVTWDGLLYCWGDGANGKLGYGNTNPVGDGTVSIAQAGPVAVGAPAIQVVAGKNHTCALLAGNRVRCWGQSTFGQLGYSNTNNIGNGVGLSIEAAGDVPLGAAAFQIAAGEEHTCALLSGGAVRCWGNGANGRLGYGNTSLVGDSAGTSIIISGDVPTGISAARLSTGNYHTCIVQQDGRARCWGSSGYGQLGHNSTNGVGDGVGSSIIGAGDIAYGGAIQEIGTGGYHTCALLSSGEIRCHGYGLNGQLGYDAINDVGNGIGLSILARGSVPAGGVAVHIETGDYHSCVLLSDESIRCWGEGTGGRLGYNSTQTIGDDPSRSILIAGPVPL